MFLTQTDIINAKIKDNRKLSDIEMLKDIINDDLLSIEKIKALKGDAYYKCKHDIKHKDFRVSNVVENEIDFDGIEKEVINEFSNPNRSNHHNVNPFHKILVDQKTSYIFGREPTITINGAEKDSNLKNYENMITDFTDEQFNEVFQDSIAEASNCGFCAIHVYYDKSDKFNYCVIPARELILIYDCEYQKELQEVIRYYDIEVINNGKKYTRKKVEWWTPQEVKYFIQDENDNYILDSSEEFNPRPHFQNLFTISDIETRRERHSWGRVPFVVLKNNSNSMSDLEPIKKLIDAYDLISSEGTNNLLDLVELFWVINGYGGESSKSIVKKLQINKAVNVINSESGNIEAKQVDLPVDGRKTWLDMLRRDIYHFGQGVDIDTSKFGTAPSGVSLKFQYSNLDLKANNMIVKLKRAIKDLLWFYTEFINIQNTTTYDSSLIKIDINKSQIMNDAEIIQEIQASIGIVSLKTLLSMHPFVFDVNEELKLIEAENKDKFQEYEKSITEDKAGGHDKQEES